MFDSAHDRETYDLASSSSIVSYFEISGLYGYRSVSISSEHAASIVIARNGSGKTTLLGALDAFLRGHLTRLRDIEFDCITCRLRGVDEPLILRSEDLRDFLDVTNNPEFTKLLRLVKFDRWTMLRFIIEEFNSLRNTYPRHPGNDVYRTICESFEYNVGNVASMLDATKSSIIRKNYAVQQLINVIEDRLLNTDIVYLPTYRRIELPLVGDGDDKRTRRQSKPDLKFNGSSLYPGNIEFGLTDISDRLETMNGEISFESSYKYREISASIISELIKDESVVTKVEFGDLPTKDDLELFFSRIKNERYTGPYNHNEIPDIEKIYSDGLIKNVGSFLKYYLSKLDPIIKSTRDKEVSVDQFVDVCNSYLTSEDLSVNLSEDNKRKITSDNDDKELILDKRNFRLSVETVEPRQSMSIDLLSSGEKQMVSLFARLYLYPKNKIVLIDEPELSLSLDWQRRILVDVLRAPSCSQVIAITHSPFVFDNVLDPFARPLIVKNS